MIVEYTEDDVKTICFYDGVSISGNLKIATKEFRSVAHNDGVFCGLFHVVWRFNSIEIDETPSEETGLYAIKLSKLQGVVTVYLPETQKKELAVRLVDSDWQEIIILEEGRLNQSSVIASYRQ